MRMLIYRSKKHRGAWRSVEGHRGCTAKTKKTVRSRLTTHFDPLAYSWSRPVHWVPNWSHYLAAYFSMEF